LASGAVAGHDAPVLSPRSTFLAAAAVVADTVDLIPSTAWNGPGELPALDELTDPLRWAARVLPAPAAA